MNEKKLMNRAADNIRILAASMVEKANSGHPGGAMGGADFVNVLFSECLVYDPENPRWEGRDRFFLDPGHMSPMLYSTLALNSLSKACSPGAVLISSSINWSMDSISEQDTRRLFSTSSLSKAPKSRGNLQNFVSMLVSAIRFQILRS